MVPRQALVVVSVVLMATLGVVVPAVSAAPGPDDRAAPATITQAALQTATNNQVNATDGATGNESAFGTQMTAFMQSNAAQTEDAVDHGMWESAFERANESERAQLAQRRAGQLDDRLADLRERNRTLAERYRNGSLSYEEYVAQASDLSGRMEALEDGVSGTSRAAERAGLNVSALDELRTNARNLSGPEVAGVARGLTSGEGGPPEGVPGRGPPGEDTTDRSGGPPEDVPGRQNAGANGNGTADSANVTTGPPNGPGGPDAGGDAGNATRGPGQRGDGKDAPPGRGAGGSGNGDDRGAPGNGNSDDDRPGNSDRENDAPGNSDRGNSGPGNDGQSGPPGNSGDNPGRGPSTFLSGDTLFTS